MHPQGMLLRAADVALHAGGALFVDADCRLDVARLPLTLSRRIAAARAAASGADAATCAAAAWSAPLCAPDDAVYAASLARFRLLRCRSSAALVEAAAALDALVAPQAAPPGATAPAATRLLLIDNLVRDALRNLSHLHLTPLACGFPFPQGAHYWQDKAARAAPGGGFGERGARAPPLDLAAVHGALGAAVGAATRRRRLVALVTKQAFAPLAPPPPAAPGGAGVPGVLWLIWLLCANPC